MIKKYKLSIGLVFLAMMSLLIANLVGTSVDAQGFLHEPAFFLIPVSYVFLFLSAITAIMTTLKRNKNSKA